METFTEKAHGQQLLEALHGVIAKVVDLHVPLSDSSHPKGTFESNSFSDDTTPKWDPADASHQLIVALERFITTIMHSKDARDGVLATGFKEEAIADDVELKSIDSVPTQGITHFVDIQLLPTWAVDQIREHVFNRMPIRLLSFESSGYGPTLIGRNEIIRRLQRAFYVESEAKGGYVFPRKRQAMAEFLERHARYAILSHTWIRDTPGDVVYNDWKKRDLNHRGYSKIAKFCEVAAQNYGVTLAWMDTVCINKESSSELDESIRSMYKWYQGAYVCVVYLSETQSLENMQHDSWFTRGWTLQELLAPKNIEFYDTRWNPMCGTEKYLDLSVHFRRDTEMWLQVQTATRITEEELEICRQGNIHRIPISRKLELAAHRNVTREEDKAYSLMGILGVDVSISYGEGSTRAFFRLVRELLSSKKRVLDMFNCGPNYILTQANHWPTKIIPSDISQYRFRSPLFDLTGQRKNASLLDQWQPAEPILLTHLGVRMPLLLVPALIREKGNFNSYLGQPYGDFYGSFTLNHWRHTQYNILDSRIYTDEQIINRPHNQSDGGFPIVTTFGILNFGVDNNNILLPQQCLAIPLDCDTLEVGSVGSSDRIRVIPLRDPTVFQVKSLNNENFVAKNDLKVNGLQLVTLYL